MGSPELGVAILIGPRRSAEETLSFLLGGPSATLEKTSKN